MRVHISAENGVECIEVCCIQMSAEIFFNKERYVKLDSYSTQEGWVKIKMCNVEISACPWCGEVISTLVKEPPKVERAKG